MVSCFITIQCSLLFLPTHFHYIKPKKKTGGCWPVHVLGEHKSCAPGFKTEGRTSTSGALIPHPLEHNHAHPMLLSCLECRRDRPIQTCAEYKPSFVPQFSFSWQVVPERKKDKCKLPEDSFFFFLVILWLLTSCQETRETDRLIIYLNLLIATARAVIANYTSFLLFISKKVCVVWFVTFFLL